MFQVINDGRLVAYTADKGEKVLDIQTGLRGGMSPPITYMLDGKQYVALAGGIGCADLRRCPAPQSAAPAPAECPPRRRSSLPAHPLLDAADPAAAR